MKYQRRPQPSVTTNQIKMFFPIHLNRLSDVPTVRDIMQTEARIILNMSRGMLVEIILLLYHLP